MVDEILKGLSSEERAFVEGAIQEFWAKNEKSEDPYDYVDNTRLADKENPEQCQAFSLAERDGCCGSATLVFGPSPSGREYVYGFNHGH